MKLIHVPPPPCDCQTKLTTFDQGEQERTGSPFGTGTIVQCDCGSRFRKGKLTWIKVAGPSCSPPGRRA